ncbi:MAG TPA: hypothetical protein DD381_08715 [Lentisphaeria bacterium]|nr:MAG: hypothetical protein A2X47_08130 [Lentisphaerae bacterium GWF2_38_69]HBM16405.1 hypothetical protein [Lentisphaeria bacterium]
MHHNILSENQKDLLVTIKSFSKEYYLVGGTAIALYLGHRRSIDFDLFTYNNVRRKGIKNFLDSKKLKYSVLFEDSIQLHIILNHVKITFFQYPFAIKANTKFDDIINLPSLLDLAAMKAYALGNRSKWKDYVDLFFIFRLFSLTDVVKRAERIFGEPFNAKLFRQQLAYFNDIDFSESIEYINEKPNENEIKSLLIDVALEPF